MTVNNWVELIVAVLSGLVVCIPLVVKLVEYIQAATKEKNWSSLMQLVLKLMVEAEKNYSTGAERKEYVIDTIKSMESTLNYDFDENVVSAMVDAIVAASKVINAEIKAMD